MSDQTLVAHVIVKSRVAHAALESVCHVWSDEMHIDMETSVEGYRAALVEPAAAPSPQGDVGELAFTAEEVRFMDRCIQGQTMDCDYWFQMHQQIRDKMFRARLAPTDADTAGEP